MSCTEPQITKVQTKISNSPGTCRVCMRKNNSMKQLFGSDCEIVDRIQFCTGILFTENPILPSFICTECLSQLDIAHNFKTTCIASEEILKKLDDKVEIKKEILDDVATSTGRSKDHGQVGEMGRPVAEEPPTLPLGNDSTLFPKDDTTVKEETEDMYEDEVEIEDFKEDVRLLIEENSNSTKKIITRSMNSTKMFSLKYTANTKELKVKCKGKKKAPQKKGKSIAFNRLHCSKCNIRFETREESLEHHERLHNILKYICEVCGKQFLNQWAHRTHMRIHYGPSLECAHCSYTTVSKGDLRRHIAIHTGEKKYHCHACPGTYRTSYNLRNHIMFKHGGQRTFPCDRCDKSFHTKVNLRQHIDTHNNVRSHECPVCHKFLSRRYHLKCHLLKQHAIQIPQLKNGRPCRTRRLAEESLLANAINVQK